MSKKILSFFAFVFVSLLTVIGQESAVPNKPENIRVLPENFKEDYQLDKYNYEESVSLITKFKIWFFQLILDTFNIEDNKDEIIIYIIYFLKFLMYLFVSIGVYFFIKMILGKEGRWLFKRNKNEYNDPEFAIEEDIQSVNFEELIQKAVKEGDYRLAIKYQYFYLLRKLDASGVIKYDPQKTTYDYQLDLEDTQYNSIFSKAAYYYTYIWYGEFSIDAKEYQTTSNVFTQLLKPLKDE